MSATIVSMLSRVSMVARLLVVSSTMGLLVRAGAAIAQPPHPDPGRIVGVQVEFEDGSVQRLGEASTTRPTDARPAPKPPQVPAPPELIALRTSGAAPATIHVHAVAPDPSAELIHTRYQWDFDDPGAPYNRLEGYSAAHTYDTPGQYTIQLRRTDPAGQVTRTRLTVQVAPDARRRLYVASDGDDSALGLSPEHPLRTPQEALRRAVDNTAILLRRGDRFDIPRTLWPTGDDLLIGAYGEGEPPLLHWTGPRDGEIIHPRPETRNLLIQDLAFDAPSDRLPVAIRAAGTNLTVRRCTFRRAVDAINANTRPDGLLVENCRAPLIDGLEGYFIWLEGAHVAVLGNAVANSTRQHIVRMNHFDTVLVAHNDFANLDRRKIDPLDDAKGGIVVQHGQRCWVVANTVLEGGIGAGPLGGPDGAAQKLFGQRSHEIVIADNLVLGRGIILSDGAQWVAVRDNRVRITNTFGIEVRGWSQWMERGVEHVWIDHNTIHNDAGARIANRPDRFGGGWKILGKTTDLHITHNLVYAPGIPMRNADGAAAVVVSNGTFDGYVDQVAGNVYWLDDGKDKNSFYVWNGWNNQGLLGLDQWRSLGARNEQLLDSRLDDNLWPTVDVGDAGARPSSRTDPPRPALQSLLDKLPDVQGHIIPPPARQSALWTWSPRLLVLCLLIASTTTRHGRRSP